MVNATVWTIIMLCKCYQTIKKDLDMLLILYIATYNHRNQCIKKKKKKNTTLKARKIFGPQTLCELICTQWDDGGSCVKSPSQESPDLIYGKWFPSMYKVVSHARWDSWKRLACRPLLWWKYPSFRSLLGNTPWKPSSRCFVWPAEALVSSYLWPTL